MRNKFTRTLPSSFEWTSHQNEVYPLAEKLTSRFTCRYTYSPSDETLESGEASQDYLAVAIEGYSCRFVICDGVSLSYRGDFAARFLGSRIFGWLGQPRELTKEGFEQFLYELVPEASEAADKLEIPSDVPLLLREVLEEKRSRGAESMYLCGRIELPEAGRSRGSLWLAWQGDCRLRRWVDNREVTIEPGSFVTKERWSGRQGFIGGSPHVYTKEFLKADENHRLMIYTDGFKRLDGCIEPSAINVILNQVLIKQAGKAHLEDDASWLELAWTT
ncbi:hypothetical protein EJP77_13495 [Paenibacillus zeisoli]|uniref:PPM-type phosphatase domain-containing protein n=1 Tax=Paenibacillus zeisoli TaxID=2496267 RepID=A0A433X6R7_9BACL|nr:hypothetical protein [Paenibacillus zeisoli]RUT29831.1 hypothetical protein EJP77_13495 [Paenibacillus zeisoli]